jgi:hypothetical protein
MSGSVLFSAETHKPERKSQLCIEKNHLLVGGNTRTTVLEGTLRKKKKSISSSSDGPAHANIDQFRLTQD